MHNYKNLHIWQDGIKLARTIYEVTNTFPANEKFGIVSQMTRAAVSIPSNIAEGAGRSSNKDFANFLSIAIGSIFELHTQIVICQQVGLINEITAKQLEEQTFTLQQQITAYKQKLEVTQPSYSPKDDPTAKRSYSPKDDPTAKRSTMK